MHMKRITPSTLSWRSVAGLGVFAAGLLLAIILVDVVYGRSARDSTANQPEAKSVSAAQHTDTPNTPTTEPPYTPDVTMPPAVGGLAPVITTLPTKQNVVFLSIDDGAFRDKTVIELMEKHHIKASLFLSKLFIASDPQFFSQLVAQGSVIENHTLSHDTNMTRTMSYLQQKNEICGMADYEEKVYGKRPTLFRPPGGAYSDTMRKAAHDCGMKAIVTWIAKANGGSMQYQVGNKLRPGDVVLMHFRPEFKQDLQAFVEAEVAAGLHTELIEGTVVTNSIS